MLNHTSTEWAPWYVIPADRKWFTRLAVAGVIAYALKDLDPEYPTLSKEHVAELQAAKELLEREE
jgi:hypothetical protein